MDIAPNAQPLMKTAMSSGDGPLIGPKTPAAVDSFLRLLETMPAATQPSEELAAIVQPSTESALGFSKDLPPTASPVAHSGKLPPQAHLVALPPTASAQAVATHAGPRDFSGPEKSQLKAATSILANGNSAPAKQQNDLAAPGNSPGMLRPGQAVPASAQTAGIASAPRPAGKSGRTTSPYPAGEAFQVAQPAHPAALAAKAPPGILERPGMGFKADGPNPPVQLQTSAAKPTNMPLANPHAPLPTALVAHTGSVNAQPMTKPTAVATRSSTRAGELPLHATGSAHPTAIPSPINVTAPIETMETLRASLSAGHQDMGTLVDTIAQAKEAHRSARGEVTLRHHDFGPVNLAVERGATDIKAVLASRDPGFAPAVHAALHASPHASLQDRAPIGPSSSTSDAGDSTFRQGDSSPSDARQQSFGQQGRPQPQTATEAQAHHDAQAEPSGDNEGPAQHLSAAYPSSAGAVSAQGVFA